jgi:hypothetical protein
MIDDLGYSQFIYATAAVKAKSFVAATLDVSSDI